MIVPFVERRAPSAVTVATAFVVLLVSAGLAGASGPDGQVRGYVTDSVTSAPIPGATVRIAAPDLPWSFEATTDGAGHFAIAAPSHQYDLTAWGPAHVSHTTTVAVGSGRTSWANLTLVAAGVRSGRILGYARDSVSGVPVTTGRLVAARPWYYGDTYRNSSAFDAFGYFEMALVSTWYDLTTEGVTGYDSYIDYSVSISNGEVLWYNFTLDPNPVNAWINGTVRDATTSDPVPGARVTARVDGVDFPAVLSGPAGAYSILVQTGNAELSADATGYAPGTTSRYVWGPGTNYVDISILPLDHAVRGYVWDGVTRGPLPGTRVTVSPLWSDGFYDEAETDASGYFEVAIPEDDFVVGAQRAGYTSWSTYIFYFTSPVVWANATLWPIASTVQGYLVDGTNGSRVPGLFVNAVDGRTSYVASDTADAGGFFTLTLPPSPAVQLIVYGQGIYTGNIAYVETQPYATTWVNITLPRANAQVRATVTNETSSLPIPGATVGASWWYGSTAATADGSGVALLDVPAGVPAYLSAGATGYQSWAGSLDPVPGQNPVSIPLRPDLPLDVLVRGYVNDTAGAPLWSVRVRAIGFSTSEPYDYTDSSGYYELWIAAAPQTIRAADTGYGAAEAAVSPAPGATVWVNLTMPPDTSAPWIRTFTANPSGGVSEANPAALVAQIEDAGLESAYLGALKLHSAAAGVGTYVLLERFPTAEVSISRPSPGNYTVTSSWDTRSPLAQLSDGTTTVRWPLAGTSGPFLGVVTGYWDNATLPSPVGANAVFDTRDGRLLYVYTGTDFVSPRDQPASTFAPYTWGLLVDLGSESVIGGSLVTSAALSVGSLDLTLFPSVPAGEYGVLLEAWDAAGGYANDVVLLQTGGDTVPPVAVAGPDFAVDEDATVTFDGSASTDNLGIASHTWTFTDGSPQTLTGAVATYVFATPGTYVVTLTVRDADGNADTDTLTVTVRDVTAPTVSIVSPSEGAIVSGSVPVTASASDNVGVVRVEFFLDGAGVGQDTSPPYEVTLPPSGLGLGDHAIVATAHDAAGNSASASRNVTVTGEDVMPPAVSITSPSEGATVSGTVVVTATATDNIGVVRVEFYLDGTGVGQDASAPYQITLPPAGLGVGDHEIEVIAYDAAGNSASDSVNVTVTQSPGGGPGAGDLTLVIVGAGVGAAIAAAAVALVLMRRRRRQASQASAPEDDPAIPPGTG